MPNFSKDMQSKVFNKGKQIKGENPAQRRKDAYGSIIDRAAYGDTNSEFGWDVDHITSLKKGGSNKLSNLQPLHWKNNRKKGSS